MKLLLFSDLHADLGVGRLLVRQAAEVDVVVCAGDVGNIRTQLPETIEVLRAIDRPTVLVAGNSESTDELVSACKKWPSAHVLHGSGVTIGGVQFFGLGGAVPVTPFGAWSYDLTEEAAAELLADCPRGAVLVSHSPPKGAADVDSRGRSLGSTAVRDAVARCQPRLVVCGHIHGSSGVQAQVGPSMVINAGPKGIVISDF